jgi:TetR/AcrR family transcriptional regulator of autoinduction and epiphytic fitness
MSLDDHRKQISDAKLAAILKAGLKHFLKHGFSRAVVADIACDADVSTATLYKHFRSKEELFAAVVADAAQSAAGYADFAQMEGSAAEILRKIVERYFTVQFDNRVNDLHRIVIGEVATSPKLAREMYQYVVERRHESFRQVLEAMIARGLLRPHNTALSATFATGMVKELAIWPALFDPAYKLPDDIDRQITTAIELFLATYGTQNEPVFAEG